MIEPDTHHATAIEALQAEGAERLAPVRFHFAQALARRAAAHQGETRRLLDERLAQALTACSQAMAQAAAPRPARAASLSPLRELLTHMADHAAEADTEITASPASTALAELKTVRQFRSTWSRLSVAQRLRTVCAQPPDNAGPLNSQRLLHQALGLMQEVSPEYLRHFVSHVDALLWLDQATAGDKKAGPGKRG